MSKRKPGPTEHCKQKLQLAQHKKDFLVRLKDMATALVGPEALSVLTTRHMEMIYRRRMQTPKLVIVGDTGLSPNDRKDFEKQILFRMKIETVLTPTGATVLFSNYYTIGLTIQQYVTDLMKDLKPEDAPFCDVFAPCLSFMKDKDEPLNRLCRIMKNLFWTINDLSKYHLRCEFKYGFDEVLLNGLYTHITLHIDEAPKKSFVVNNHSRPAYKLGWVVHYNELVFSKVKPSQLGIKNDENDQEMDVYVQSHALRRLVERLDTLHESFSHCFLFYSLVNPTVICDSRGTMLIEYQVMRIKVGYVIADIVDGCLLIRTFLFLTNNGTPEGKKLEQITGLGRLDKKYLAIDKLSAFISSDLCDNQAVVDLLLKSGCESLIELLKNERTIFVEKDRHYQQTGALLAKYLQLNKQEEPVWEEACA